jgi:hypothetical protein
MFTASVQKESSRGKSFDGGQMTEDRRQMTEDRRQRSEDRCQRTDVRGQRTDVRYLAGYREQKTE